MFERKIRIMLVEDVRAQREIISLNLEGAHFEVVSAASGEEALKIFEDDRDFDVIILDIGLPGINGFDVCKRIRAKNTNIGIIMLTAEAVREDENAYGLNLGADDYIIKPVDSGILNARIRAIYRRIQPGKYSMDAPTIMHIGPFELNSETRVIHKNGAPLDLTSIEFNILEYFMHNKEVAIDRETLLKNVWSEGYIGEKKIVDVNIRRLRAKIEEVPDKPKFLITMWGFGYKFTEGV